MKRVTIEELLAWAFVHELPKGGGVEGLANRNSAWAQFAELGTRVSTGATGGGSAENYFIEQGDPSPDALEVGAAVAALGRATIIIPAGWNPLADWSGVDDLAAASIACTRAAVDARSAARLAEGVVALVVGASILGRPPEWAAEQPKTRMVERGGKPAWFVVRAVTDDLGGVHHVEVDGFNKRTQRPMKGAYRRYEFSEDPAGVILSRLDWQWWVAALRTVHAALDGRLAAHRLVPFEASATPWLTVDAGGVTIVPETENGRRKKTALAR